MSEHKANTTELHPKVRQTCFETLIISKLTLFAYHKSDFKNIPIIFFVLNREKLTFQWFLVSISLEKRRRQSRRFFLGPAGSWLGFAQPVCFTLWGMAALDSLRSLLSFFYSPRSSLWSPLSFPLVTNVYLFGHQRLSLWSLRVHSFEVKCDKRRTNERTYGPDGITNYVCYLYRFVSV